MYFKGIHPPLDELIKLSDQRGYIPHDELVMHIDHVTRSNPSFNSAYAITSEMIEDVLEKARISWQGVEKYVEETLDDPAITASVIRDRRQ